MKPLTKVMVLAALLSACHAQKASDFALQTRHANVVCAATVLAVEPPTRSRNTYLVRVRVDDGIRGAQANEELTITEWSGLWEQGRERYKAGERYVLFLESSKGVTSLATGDAGRLKIEKDHTIVVNPSAERAMRLQGKVKQSRVAYVDLIESIRAAVREQR